MWLVSTCCCCAGLDDDSDEEEDGVLGRASSDEDEGERVLLIASSMCSVFVNGVNVAHEQARRYGSILFDELVPRSYCNVPYSQ